MSQFTPDEQMERYDPGLVAGYSLSETSASGAESLVGTILRMRRELDVVIGALNEAQKAIKELTATVDPVAMDRALMTHLQRTRISHES
jgi:hypothetical protein